MGITKVLCAVSVEERVPPFMKGPGKGWVTSEGKLLSKRDLDAMLALADSGLQELFRLQAEAVGLIGEVGRL